MGHVLPVPRPLTIVADDLTGALDAAAGGASAGSAAVVLDAGAPWPDVDLLAVDTATRHAPEPVARARVEATVGRAVAAARSPFVKIDSLLRGNTGVQVAAGLAGLSGSRAIAVVAPAFPATGRTTADGVVHVHGVPHAGGAHGGRVLDALAAGGLAAAQVPAATDAAALARRLRRVAEEGYPAVVVDAVTDAHLACVVAATRLLDVPALLTGCGGLAAHLLPPRAAPPAPPGAYAVGAVLTVVGSYSELAGAQVGALVRTGVRRIHPPASPADAAADLVLTPDPATPLDPRHAPAVAAALGAHAAALADRAGALVLTGGETARAVLDALGVARLDVLRELEPGVVLSRAAGLAPLIVTKSGAFGDAGTLVRIRTLLKRTDR